MLLIVINKFLANEQISKPGIRHSTLEAAVAISSMWNEWRMGRKKIGELNWINFNPLYGPNYEQRIISELPVSLFLKP